MLAVAATFPVVTAIANCGAAAFAMGAAVAAMVVAESVVEAVILFEKITGDQKS